MKRNEKLQPLSRQHHNELMACLLIKKGIGKKADLKVMQRFAGEFWNQDLKKHVEQEEIRLIPLLMRKDSFKHYAYVLHNDHQIIERIFDRSQNGHLSFRTLELFVDNIEEHIRFEERVVFPLIQQEWSDEELDRLFFEETNAKTCSGYTENFWE